MPHVSNAQIKAALTAQMGVIVLAAKQLGVTRQAIHLRVNASPELQAHIADVEETMLDVAEGVAKSAIIAQDKQMTRWFLDRKGRNRGYVTRSEQTGADGEPLNAPQAINVVVQYVAGQGVPLEPAG